MGIHHVGIAVADLEESVRFYRDGLGYPVLLEEVFDREWDRLVASPSSRMRAIVVAPTDGSTCAIELIAFEDGVERPTPVAPPAGLFLLSLMVPDVAAAKANLTAVGYSTFEEDSTDLLGSRIDVTFVRDPDGVVVELVSAAQVAAAMGAGAG